ncbi:MAG TPA: hypothetical protein VMH36_27545 [Alphaproteobacteria bacterium]|nr:hypothetical protein [Alphaproteobacteria bacterium]
MAAGGAEDMVDGGLENGEALGGGVTSAGAALPTAGGAGGVEIVGGGGAPVSLDGRFAVREGVGGLSVNTGGAGGGVKVGADPCGAGAAALAAGAVVGAASFAGVSLAGGWAGAGAAAAVRVDGAGGAEFFADVFFVGSFFAAARAAGAAGFAWATGGRADLAGALLRRSGARRLGRLAAPPGALCGPSSSRSPQSTSTLVFG